MSGKSTTLNRLAGRAGGTIRWLSRVPVRINSAILESKRAKEAAAEAVPSLQQRQDDLIGFYYNYEELVELLVDASRYGPTPKLTTRYTELRRILQARYLLVKPYVVAYLKLAVDDTQINLSFSGEPGDAFEALFAAPDLNRLLLSDDGTTINRINRTREALVLYGEHIRQLIAQSK